MSQPVDEIIRLSLRGEREELMDLFQRQADAALERCRTAAKNNEEHYRAAQEVVHNTYLHAIGIIADRVKASK